jgi:LuxR family transcriptional regulator
MARRHGAGFDAFLESASAPWTATLAAAARAGDPEPHLKPLLIELGFDGLTCIALAPSAAGGERPLHLWSTWPAGWQARYRENGYAGVDPRVTLSARRLSPVIWDAADADRGWHVRRFLADAARHGVRSGFAASFRDAAQIRIVVAFDSSRSPMSGPECANVVSRLGELMLLAAALHDRVLRPRCGAMVTPVARGCAGLTAREQACVNMAANGLTSADIGAKLGIAERTVNFHMRNVLRKLEAVNRTEAIAKALARGILDAATTAQRSV